VDFYYCKNPLKMRIRIRAAELFSDFDDCFRDTNPEKAPTRSKIFLSTAKTRTVIRGCLINSTKKTVFFPSTSSQNKVLIHLIKFLIPKCSDTLNLNLLRTDVEGKSYYMRNLPKVRFNRRAERENVNFFK
jgi:hypothetical protein